MTARRYTTLDAMRTIAALLVVASHFSYDDSRYFVPKAYLAVDLFFLLSGFVIAHAYGRRLSNSIGLRTFAFIRLIRLYPLYALGMLGGIGISLLGMRAEGHWDPAIIGPWLTDAAAALAILPAPFALDRLHSITPFDLPGWSLQFEILVNLIAAAIWTKLGNRTLGLIVLCAGTALVVALYAAGSVRFGADINTLPAGFARTVFSFGLGILLHRWRGSAQQRISWVAWLVPLALAGVLAAQIQIDFWYDFALIFAVFPAFIIIGAHVEPKNHAIFESFGRLSYAIYIVHAPAILIFTSIRHHLDLNYEIFDLLLMPYIYIVAWIVDRYFDQPVRKWLTAKWRATQPKVSAHKPALS